MDGRLPDGEFSLPFLEGRIVLGGQRTAGAFAMLDMRLRPGRGPDAHIHRDQDEHFYILEGEYTVRSGDSLLIRGPGELVTVERGTPHALKAGPEGGRHLTLFAPAGPEGWFVEAAVLAASGALDQAAIKGLFERFGMEQAGPDVTGML